MKVLKFGGTSMADAGQYQKIKNIVEADPTRRVVVVSAPGKRFSGDYKVTDLLYLCHAHLKYGVSCDGIFDMIRHITQSEFDFVYAEVAPNIRPDLIEEGGIGGQPSDRQSGAELQPVGAAPDRCPGRSQRIHTYFQNPAHRIASLLLIRICFLVNIIP